MRWWHGSIVVLFLLAFALYWTKGKIDINTNETTKEKAKYKEQKDKPKLSQEQSDINTNSIVSPKNKEKDGFENAATPQDQSKQKIKSRPKSMKEVILTPGIEEGLKEFHPNTVYLWDYLLGFLDRLDKCLNGRVHTSGTIQAAMVFEIDQETKMGNGVDFYLDGTSLTAEETEIVEDCGKSSVIDTSFDLSHISKDTTEGHYFSYMPTINLPIEENFVYKFIEADGSPEEEQ